MAERYPGGVISKTPPTITAPVDGEGGSASGMWTLDTVLEYEKAGAWPKPVLPRELYSWGRNNFGNTGFGHAPAFSYSSTVSSVHMPDAEPPSPSTGGVTVGGVFEITPPG